MSLAALQGHRRVYIATPYTKYKLGIQEAWKTAVEVSSRLKKAGVVLYSPIVHSHPIAIMGNIDPLDFKMWIADNISQVEDADACAVVLMDGWAESFGVQDEIKKFKDAGKPIYLVHPVTLEVTLAGPTGELTAEYTLPLTPLEQYIADAEAAGC
jgi:hypothetical protein